MTKLQPLDVIEIAGALGWQDLTNVELERQKSVQLTWKTPMGHNFSFVLSYVHPLQSLKQAITLFSSERIVQEWYKLGYCTDHIPLPPLSYLYYDTRSVFLKLSELSTVLTAARTGQGVRRYIVKGLVLFDDSIQARVFSPRFDPKTNCWSDVKVVATSLDAACTLVSQAYGWKGMDFCAFDTEPTYVEEVVRGLIIAEKERKKK